MESVRHIGFSKFIQKRPLRVCVCVICSLFDELIECQNDTHLLEMFFFWFLLFLTTAFARSSIFNYTLDFKFLYVRNLTH